ncbi:MAG: heme A synthase [Myxococcota bacterium]
MPDPAAAIRDNASTSPRASDPAGLARLGTAFLVLVAATTGLIVLGALVRAHAAGLACPDWPLCFGEVIPQLNLEVAFEWSHRAIAGGVSLSFAVLALLVFRRSDAPRGARALVGVAAALLALQVLLGALTVWLLLASWTVTAHLITGNSLSLTLLLVACSLRDAAQPRPPRPPATAAVRGLVIASAVLLLVQMALGGLVSSNYAGMACPEWPTCNGGQWFPTWGGHVGLHLLHRSNGYALVTVLAVSAARCSGDAELRRWTSLALLLGVCEALVGISNVLLGIPVEITGLHSALAAALVLTLTRAVRDVTTRGAPRP